MNFSVNPILPPFYEEENRTPPYITFNTHDLYPRQMISLHCFGISFLHIFKIHKLALFQLC